MTSSVGKLAVVMLLIAAFFNADTDAQWSTSLLHAGVRKKLWEDARGGFLTIRCSSTPDYPAIKPVLTSGGRTIPCSHVRNLKPIADRTVPTNFSAASLLRGILAYPESRAATKYARCFDVPGFDKRLDNMIIGARAGRKSIGVFLNGKWNHADLREESSIPSDFAEIPESALGGFRRKIGTPGTRSQRGRWWAMCEDVIDDGTDQDIHKSISAGSRLAAEECKQQFRWEKWNCPKKAFSNIGETSRPNKENAFIHAITSAAVSHTLTRNCTAGHFGHCGCDMRRRAGGQSGVDGWQWGGCSDNFKFGDKISRKFTDAMETGRDAVAMANLHNNRAGRVAVRRTMRKICKCHGVSGSCTTKTCWMTLGQFREVGDFLKQQYNMAVKLDQWNAKYGMWMTNSVDGHKKRGDHDDLSLMDSLAKRTLVFIEKSFDYCSPNPFEGTNGTRGRECSRRRGQNVTQEERTSCRTLCRDCGLKVRRRIVDVPVSCNCKFVWCCQVKCDTCIRSTEVASCER
ncbi:unnamed protein product [Notodromas monacha]|uniref:Protein Wnt n=1 Tax=Notodromas monacha TaxID=399045 RepID=A0A7R9BCY9_9CRUS|nr:unnamed protein product [Notodromas monacha]CAG0912493.1 unnamed protein product [Notodromas monacha]